MTETKKNSYSPLKLGVKAVTAPIKKIAAPEIGKKLTKGTLRRSVYEFGKKQGWWD